MPCTISEEKLLLCLVQLKRQSIESVAFFGNDLRKGQLNDFDCRQLEKLISEMYKNIDEAKDLVTNIKKIRAAAGV